MIEDKLFIVTVFALLLTFLGYQLGHWVATRSATYTYQHLCDNLKDGTSMNSQFGFVVTCDSRISSKNLLDNIRAGTPE